MVGEFNEELKQEIDDMQEYIDALWETGYGNLTPRWVEEKQTLIDLIGKEE